MRIVHFHSRYFSSSVSMNTRMSLHVCVSVHPYVSVKTCFQRVCLQHRIPTWLSLSPSRHQVSVGVGEPPADRHVSCVWRPSSSGPTSSCSWCPEEFRMSGGPGGTAGEEGGEGIGKERNYMICCFHRKGITLDKTCALCVLLM